MLPAEDANARIVKLKVDGVDLGESGEMSERDVGVANRFADLARLADLREAFEQKRHLDRWTVREEGHSTARAELAALSVYFPQENGMDTMPEGVREHRTLVLWNGLFLRDEAIDQVDFAKPPFQMILQDTIPRPRANVRRQLIKQRFQQPVRVFDVFLAESKNGLDFVAACLADSEGLASGTQHKLAHSGDPHGLRQCQAQHGERP